jgi:hypothetical protein
MAFTQAQVDEARGRWLISYVDPRAGLGLDLQMGTVVTYISGMPGGCLVLQKQGMAATDWVVIPGTGGAGSSWGAPANTITANANTNIPATASAVLGNAAAGPIVLTLPAVATQAVAIAKTDATDHAVQVMSTTGNINNLSPLFDLISQQNQSAIFIQGPGGSWQAF